MLCVGVGVVCVWVCLQITLESILYYSKLFFTFLFTIKEYNLHVPLQNFASIWAKINAVENVIVLQYHKKLIQSHVLFHL